MILAYLSTADKAVVVVLFAIAVLLRATYSTRLTDDERSVQQFLNARNASHPVCGVQTKETQR